MQIVYEVIEGPISAWDCPPHTAYGLRCRVDGTPAAQVEDLFESRAEAAAVAALLTREGLEPVHLRDVACDYLAGARLG